MTRVVCAADARGSGEAIERVLEATASRDVQAVVLVENLSDGLGGAEATEERAGCSSADSRRSRVGGVLTRPAGAVRRSGRRDRRRLNHSRDGRERLSYPRWEAEYRLKLLRELEEHQMVLVFWTQPSHKGLGAAGSELVAELVNSHRPRLVACAGERRTAMLGRSLVVAPASPNEGHYAVVDLHTREVELEELAAARN